MFYLYIFLASFILSVILTSVVKKLAGRFNIVDKPDADRKIHGKPVPLLGGVAVFISFFVSLLFLSNRFLSKHELILQPQPGADK